MSLEFFVNDAPLISTWTDIVKIKPKKLHSLLIYADDAAIEIGSGGAGLPRAQYESFSLTWQDFDRSRLKDDDVLIIRGKTAATANAVVVLITDV